MGKVLSIDNKSSQSVSSNIRRKVIEKDSRHPPLTSVCAHVNKRFHEIY